MEDKLRYLRMRTDWLNCEDYLRYQSEYHAFRVFMLSRAAWRGGKRGVDPKLRAFRLRQKDKEQAVRNQCDLLYVHKLRGFRLRRRS